MKLHLEWKHLIMAATSAAMSFIVLGAENEVHVINGVACLFAMAILYIVGLPILSNMLGAPLTKRELVPPLVCVVAPMILIGALAVMHGATW